VSADHAFAQTPASAAPGHEQTSRRTHNAGNAAIVLIAAFLMDLIDVTIVNVALPSIQHGLRLTPRSWSGFGGLLLAFAAA